MRKIRNNNSDKSRVQNVLLDKIESEFYNIRTEYDESSIHELAQSIENHGLLQPVTLVKDGEKYRIIAGHRRYLAYRYLLSQEKPTYNQIPALVKDSIRDVEEVQLVENIQREDLSPTDTETAVKHLKEKYKDNEKIARIVGKSESWVKQVLNTSRIRKKVSQLTLPEAVKNHFNELPISVVSELSGLDDLQTTEAVSQLTQHDKPTQKTARETKQSVKGKKAKSSALKNQINPEDLKGSGLSSISAAFSLLYSSIDFNPDQINKTKKTALNYLTGEKGQGGIIKKMHFTDKQLKTLYDHIGEMLE